MSADLCVVVVRPDRDRALAARLLQVQHAGYRAEAALIGDDRIPALHEDVADLVAAGLSWLACMDGDQLVGALGWVDGEELVELDRLVVDPAAHRRGAGTALVDELLHQAATRPVSVSTGRANLPARALYERLGFVEISDSEPVPGLWTTRYEHSPVR